MKTLLNGWEDKNKINNYIGSKVIVTMKGCVTEKGKQRKVTGINMGLENGLINLKGLKSERVSKCNLNSDVTIEILQ